MKTFKEILMEIFNKSRPVGNMNIDYDTHARDIVYSYKIKHQGNPYTVAFLHNDDNDTAEVQFKNKKGSTKKTGTSGTSSVGVFSHVKSAIDKHIESHPRIKKIKFVSLKNPKDDPEGSRSKLYTSITKRFGGTTEDRGNMSVHTIPVKRKK